MLIFGILNLIKPHVAVKKLKSSLMLLVLTFSSNVDLSLELPLVKNGKQLLSWSVFMFFAVLCLVTILNINKMMTTNVSQIYYLHGFDHKFTKIAQITPFSWIFFTLYSQYVDYLVREALCIYTVLDVQASRFFWNPLLNHFW